MAAILLMELANHVEDGPALVHADRAGPPNPLAHSTHPARGQFGEARTTRIEPVEPNYGKAAGALVSSL